LCRRVCKSCLASRGKTVAFQRLIIFIIPLTIITLAFLIPESYNLKILSSFFGVATTALVVTSGLLRNTITDTYNLRLILVTKVMSLQEKQELFKQEVTRLLNEYYATNLNFLQYLGHKLTDKYFQLLTPKLNLLKNNVEIKAYATETVSALHKAWEQAQLMLAHEKLR